MSERITIDSNWIRSLRRGQPPSHTDLREHLLAVHRHHAGFTEALAWQCRDASGRNSYEWLAELVDPDRHQRLLDMACGSGVLIAVCHQRYRSKVALLGVDMSADELALARQRVPDKDVKLHHGVAQDMSFIANESIDVVLCHWALTLMAPVEPVLIEVRRVLSRNGMFAAIVDGEMSAAPGYAELHHIIYGWVQREYPDYGEIELGDARVRMSKALIRLMEKSCLGAKVKIEPAVVNLYAAPSVLAREVAAFFYATFVLSTPNHQRMLDELERHFAAQGHHDRSRFALPINRLIVERV